MSYEKHPWHAKHSEELKQYSRKYRAEHPEYLKRNAQKAKEKRDRMPEFFKAREFSREMKKYGTTVEWYLDQLVTQSGLCAICSHLSHHHGTIQRLQVDHNHDCCNLRTKSCGKCLRGLLCADCNILLSYLERFLAQAQVLPSPVSWTARAVLYLRRYSA